MNFPYIKLSLDKNRPVWIRYDIITEVYVANANDGHTRISTAVANENDFAVLESVDEVIEKLRAYYCPGDTIKPSAIISDSARPSYDNAPSSISYPDPFPGGW